MASGFRGILDFFDNIGLFDVVLPFLLVFAIVFAIFEKTKVLGTDIVDGTVYTKKNLNAIVAFSISFLVVASSELVEIITKVSSQMVVLMFLGVFFLLLVGIFFREGEPVYLDGGWKVVTMVIMGLGIAGIFLNTLKTDNGDTWLERIMDFFRGGTDELVGSIVLLAIIVGFMIFMIRDPQPKVEKK